MASIRKLILTAVGAWALAGAASAGLPPAGPQSERVRSAESAAALAEAYWSDRTGRLPPNRPVTVRPPPERSRYTPADPARGGRNDQPAVALPGRRSH
jgi:hypothetical protein